MIQGLDGTLDPVLSDLPASLRSSAIESNLRSAAHLLPPILRGGFEVHLTPGAERVDLQQCLYRASGEPAVAAAYLDARAGEHDVDPAWLSVRDFCHRWAEPHSWQHAHVGELWLEIDAVATTAAPVVFFGLRAEDGVPYDPAPTIESLVREFLRLDRDQPLQRSIARCLAACESPAVVTHLGAMLSRDPVVVRLNVALLTPQAISPFLERIGWPGPVREVERLVADLCSKSARFVLCLDVGDAVQPRLGFECVPSSEEGREDGGREDGWLRFLQPFVDAGACSAEVLDGLSHWPGLRHPWTASRWPAHLIGESLLRAPNRVSTIERSLSHLKVDYRPGKPLAVKAYIWFAHRWVRPGETTQRRQRLDAGDPRAETATASAEYRAQVKAYYEATNAEYLAHVGDTFQADLVSPDGRSDDAAASNRQLAAWAGIGAGDRVLDAGCGVAGPAVDIAGAHPGVRIEGVTLSPAQARTAHERIATAGLAERVRVSVADYHDLPYGDGCFDVVVFFESSGYSDDRARLFREVHRVLRRGGRLYVKDAFRPDRELGKAERDGLAEFDRIYAHRTPALGETVALLEHIGFEEVRSRDLSPFANKQRWGRAFGEVTHAAFELTPFGELHFHAYPALPVFPGEIRALRP